MPEACITVWSQKMELDHATVRSRVFWGLQYSPVPNLRTGPYRSLDRTGLQNHTSVRSQNSEPDRLQISPVQSGPSPTVRSGQSSTGSGLVNNLSQIIHKAATSAGQKSGVLPDAGFVPLSNSFSDIIARESHSSIRTTFGTNKLRGFLRQHRWNYPPVSSRIVHVWDRVKGSRKMKSW